MKQYLDMLRDIYENGSDSENRTGIKTRKKFGYMMRFNMEDGFPAVTTKRLAFKQVLAELLWFISGSENVKDLQKMGCHIWDGNAYADYWVESEHCHYDGHVGEIYGVKWRRWKRSKNHLTGKSMTFDQLAWAIDTIKKDPNNRRIIINSWDGGAIYEKRMCLPPCHMFSHFFVDGDKLSLYFYCRSQDTTLGTPFNTASYALLLHMVAQVTGLKPYELIHAMGDSHIYFSHFGGVEEQLKRKPYQLPKLWINPEIKDIDSFTMNDFKLLDYKCHSKIKYDMVV